MNAATVFAGFLRMSQVKNMARGGFPLRVSRNAVSTVSFPQSIALEYMLYNIEKSIVISFLVGDFFCLQTEGHNIPGCFLSRQILFLIGSH